MMKRLSRVLLVIAAILITSSAFAQVPAFDRVFIIVLENKEYSDIIGNPDAPYLNMLASRNGLATNYDGVTHPSLPNYMALTGGDTFFADNCLSCRTAAVNIVDRLEAAGRSWAAYMEDMPASCGAADAGLYVARHNPFVHYSNIESDPARCGRVVPFTRFASDLSSGQIASYVWITPNLCSDMHDCSIATGDAWLAGVVPQILQSASFANSALFITWDEGTSAIGGGGRTPLIVVSPWTTPGTQVSTAANHYSLLRTIEDAWQLAPLGQSANASALAGFFASPLATASEQVIYAADVTSAIGWTKVADSTAAGGVKLSNRDTGAPTVAQPAAAPANYFDASFDAVAGTRYRVWLRIHAIDDSKLNDSVFVQFSDSVDAVGSPVNRIGSSSGYIVNLWTCATCQSFGWGWQRNAYWLPDTGDVWFPSSGRHTIRVQTREDGVEIDQIVISPAVYANDAPGPVSADHTIVPKPGDNPPPPPPSTLPSPWSSADVGSTGQPGSAAFASGTFTVKGAGADIWDTEDAFQFVSQPLAADGTVIARVTSLQNTDSYAKAGVMLRQTTDAGSAHVLLNLRPDGRIELLTRAANGGETSFVAGGSAPFPRWLRLARSGNTVTASISPDGTTWATVGSATTSFGSGRAGLAVTSHDASTATTAAFDNVSVTASGSPPPPSPSPATAVIYASDIPAANRHGSWIVAADSSSPNATRLETPDAGIAYVDNALASPADYVDVTFTANAATPYTLWLRLRAAANAKLNDSVWVQFSDARAGANAVYPLNSTSGLLVNLATDSSASSLNAWGWQNNAYWLTQNATVSFASSGTHTLRIQVREDGVAFDQIVISPDRYLSASPGGPSGDQTIVLK